MTERKFAFLCLATVFVLLCTAQAHPAPAEDESENELEDYSDDESLLNLNNLTDTETGSSTTVKPVPRVQVPPPVVDQLAEKRNGKLKPFEKNQNYYPAQVEIFPRRAGQPEHDILEMTAYCYANEVDMFLRFSSGFQGYIYPYHHFRRCQLFTGDGQGEVNFLITEDSCGLDVTYTSANGTLLFMEFTFMIQWDKRYITRSDRKLRVTCNRAESHQQAVMLVGGEGEVITPVVSMKVETDDDEEEDEDGDGSSRDLPMRAYDAVQVGDEVSVMLSIKSPVSGPVDANVVRCVAHDGQKGVNEHHVIRTYSAEETDAVEAVWDSSTTMVSSGCSKDQARFADFEKEKTGEKAVDLTSVFHVFRFPSSHFLFLECYVQLCAGECPNKLDCEAKLKTEVSDSPGIQTVKLFRPLMVKLGPLVGVSPMDEHLDEERALAPTRGVPTASFIAGLVGMGFICAIICVFMYRRFKKGTEKEYKMEYSPNAAGAANDNNREEVAPLKVTPTSGD